MASFMCTGVVDAPLDPGVGAIGVVFAHVRDGRVVWDIERVRYFGKSFAIDGQCGIRHAFVIIDGSEQAVEIFLETLAF